MKRIQHFHQVAARLLRGRVPGQLVIQLTDHCNARCPQCGMRTTERFQRSRLCSDAVRGMIDAAAEKGVRALSLTGGEPMLFRKELMALIRYAGQAGIPFLRTGTNGFFFTGADRPGFEDRIETIAEALAETPIRNFWISLDSALPAIHESMRGFPGVVAGIEKALPIFHRHGIYPSVNLGINRNITEATRSAPPEGIQENPEEYTACFYDRYRNAFRAFYRFVIELGFTIVNSCYPMSVEPDADVDRLSPVYAASSEDAVVRYTPAEKALLFKAMFDTIPEFRSRIRIFSPRISLYALHRQYAGDETFSPCPCRGGIDFFFIDARDGMTYPCGYRGHENMGDFRNLDLDRIENSSGCLECDWECFRDPSELFGPLLQARSAPGSVLRKFSRDPEYRRLWFEDLKYYRACDLFDGRRPPDATRLAKFGPSKSVKPCGFDHPRHLLKLPALPVKNP
ncbi:MAG: radical SAM protein [Thermodesulfobacteriota bacterium]